MEIIAISGLDGSGKSTQAQNLKQYLEHNGHTVFSFHAVTFSVANILNTGKGRSKDGKTPDVATASWISIQLRKVALCIDMLRFRLLVMQCKKKGFDYLLTDRYFTDMIINIAYLSHKNYMPFFRSFMIMPDHALFLRVTPEQIMHRTSTPAQGIDYLIAKDALYNTYAQKFDMTVIDGAQSSEEVFAAIKKKIFSAA
jgi:thymidylate kinase